MQRGGGRLGDVCGGKLCQLLNSSRSCSRARIAPADRPTPSGLENPNESKVTGRVNPLPRRPNILPFR
jgi:hypothetical protein